VALSVIEGAVVQMPLSQVLLVSAANVAPIIMNVVYDVF
jgi:hypothetical protein